MAGSGHFVVAPESSVEDMFRGLVVMYPSLTVDYKSRIVLSSQEEIPASDNPSCCAPSDTQHSYVRPRHPVINHSPQLYPAWTDNAATFAQAMRTPSARLPDCPPTLPSDHSPGTALRFLRSELLTRYQLPRYQPRKELKTNEVPKEEEVTRRSVGLLSGGGSGHEPFAAGFVGKGMLTGAVAGEIFTSPPPTTILKAIYNVEKISPGGVLVLYNNYTGDCLNFGLAMEKAKMRGLNVKSIIIDDDCAIDSPRDAGRRGLCGCLFVFKIAGGMAELGEDLESIYNECLKVKRNIATFGVTLKPCNMPGSGPMFQIEEGYMELGVGVHGEAGAAKYKVEDADEIAGILVDKLYKTLKLKAGDSVCVIINNLGGSSQLELYLMAGLVYDELRERHLNIKRQYTGTLMTSLDMSGIQVSLLLLPYSRYGDEELWLRTLDYQTNAFAWPVTSLSAVPARQTRVFAVDDADTKALGPKILDEEANALRRCLKAAAEALMNNEKTLNELDRGCGDGDTGSTLRRLADAIIKNINSFPVNYPQKCFTQLSKMAEDLMGGTSGALYSLMFLGASERVPDWTAAWQAALAMAMTYSRATLGSRTMFDALIPACETYAASDKGHEALNQAVQAAVEGCQRTQHYPPL